MEATDIQSWIKAAVGILPILMGVASLKWFKDWAYSEKEMGNKVKQAKENITEQLAESNTDLLDAFNKGAVLRGDPPQKPDIAARYAKTQRKQFSYLFKIETAAMMSYLGYSIIFVTIIVALLGFIGTLLAVAFKNSFWCETTFVVGFVLFVCQIIVFMWLRQLKVKIDTIHDEF